MDLPTVMRMRALCFIGLASSVILYGCSVESLGRKLGSGMVDGIKQKEDSLSAVVDSVLGGHVYPETRRVYNAMLSSTKDTLDFAMVRFGNRIDSDIDPAFQNLVHHNLQAARQELSATLRQAIDEAGAAAARNLERNVSEAVAAGLERAIAPRLDAMANSASRSAMAGLRDGLNQDVRPALRNAVDELGERVDVRVGKTGDRFRNWFYGAIALLFGGLVVGVLIVRRMRLQKRTVGVLVSEIERYGDPDLKKSIRKRAQIARVENWLHGVVSQSTVPEIDDREAAAR